MRVGLRLPQYAATWTALRAGAERAEALGFDALWVNDHLQAPGRRPTDPAFDAFTALAALAPLTGRARLGVAVASASYRPPALTAKMATALDVIAGGRLTLGLGAGSDRAEHGAYGIPFGTPAERTAGVRRALAALRAMAAAPAGANVPGLLRDAPNLPASPQPGGVPVWLAAHRPVLLRLAGREADGVIAAFLTPDDLAARRRVTEEAREAAGRPPLAYAVYLYALPVRSAREAERWLAPEAAALGTTPARLLRWLGTTGLTGEPAALRDGLAAHAAAGATDVILVLPNRVPPETIDALAEAVLPAPAPRTEPARPAPAASGRSARANLAHRLVERPREEGGSSEPAAIDDAGAWTWDELARAAARAAGALREAGVRRGERVAVALPDGRPWLAAFLGAAWLGAVAVPLDPASPAERLDDILADCEPGVLVAETGDDGQLAVAATANWPSLDPAGLDAGPALEMAAVHPQDLAYLIYSSGSTGRPKGAMHAHRDVEAGIETYARAVLGLGPGDRCHSVAKGFTSLGFGNGFFRVLGRGATAVLSRRRPTVRTVLALVERHDVTVLTAVPTFWSQLARHLERHPAPGALAGVRLGVSSGDSLPPSVAERVRDVGGLDLLEGLGCSECSNIVISTRPGRPRPGTLGDVVPGVEVRLADDAGAEVPDGEPGRLWIRSESNTTGYWRRIEETRELVFGPWIRMADVLARSDGLYRHLGRADDLFKVDARWVSPTAVEAALVEHPAIAEAAVVGRPDADGLLRPAAVVVLASGASDPGLAELRRHVAHRIAPYAAPAGVRVVAELPRLPSGKVDRRRLRDAPADPPPPESS